LKKKKKNTMDKTGTFFPSKRGQED
jgi:hypothetical protein